MKASKIHITLLLLAGLLPYKGLLAQSFIDQYLTHRVTVHYPDHTIIAVVEPTDPVKTKSNMSYYWFAGNQINITQGGYSGKLLHGLYQDFYLNKNLKEEGIFKQGLKTGRWKHWSEGGRLFEESTFKHGIKNGRYSKYDTAGKMVEKGRYKQGFLHGQHKRISGDSTSVFQYRQGKMINKKRMLPAFMYKIFGKKTTEQKQQ